MNFIQRLFKAEKQQQEYVAPVVESRHNTLLYLYCEKYLNALNPRHRYDVRETLRSGQIITHCTDVSLQEAKDYVRMVWIESVPPNFIVEVTTSVDEEK